MFLQRLCVFLVCVSSVHVWADTSTQVGDCAALTKEQCTSDTDYYWVCTGQMVGCLWDNGACVAGAPIDAPCY
jgi:hypothetical protein